MAFQKKYNNSNSADSKKSFIQDLTDKVIEAMQDGDMKWKKTWDSLATSNPYNPMTGNEYNGINRIALAMSEHSDPRYLTFKQATDLGYQIQRGSKALSVIHFHFLEKEVENKDGEKDIERIPSLKEWKVFNAEDIIGIPPLTAVTEKQFNEIENVEQLITNSGAVIKFGGNQPCYVPSIDVIKMPNREQFHTEIDYYSTLLHETVHWTGHESRLDRLKDNGGHGTKSYAQEELIAELGSIFTSAQTGIPLNDEHFKHHAQYLNGWISLLQDDKNALFKAASKAQKATDFVMQYSPERVYDIQIIESKTKKTDNEIAPEAEVKVESKPEIKPSKALTMTMSR